jgi:hypothetical protein
MTARPDDLDISEANRHHRGVSPMVGAWLLVAMMTAGCGVERSVPSVDPPHPRQAIIGALQTFQEGLGIERTGNFQRFSDAAIHRCYFTGVLELPSSYDALRLIETSEPTCPIDERTYDVFLYSIEAVASGSSPVSPALAEASLHRALVVVSHEDFHNQQETGRASVEIAEGAATLAGFLSARDFARARYGNESEIARRLDSEAERFLVKANIVNSYYRGLADVYSARAAGRMTRSEALARKAALFAELEQACNTPDPSVSFNDCPTVLNNAGLAFDRTYTRHYPAWFSLHQALDGDTAATIIALRRVLATGPRSEADLAAASAAWLSRLESEDQR